MMQTAELAVLDWIQAHLRCGFLDAVLPVVSWTCNHGEIWILLAAVLLLWKKHRWTGVSVSFALILDLVCCNMILKPLVGRIRPFAVNTAVELLTAAPTDASFPSGHTAASFGGVRRAGRRQPPVEAGGGAGRRDRLLPAVPVRPLAHRHPGRHRGGSPRGRGGRQAGGGGAEESEELRVEIGDKG